MTLSGCAQTVPTAAGAAADAASDGPSPAHSTHASATPSKSASAKPKPTPTHTKTTPAHSMPAGPRIVSFRIAQKPKCAEGTAVFRAPAVPLIIKWEITGATGGALSVDDHTHTPGTYGQVKLEGSEEFTFTCAGAVGSTETHTYAIYTVGGGATRSATLQASAKILDKGK